MARKHETDSTVKDDIEDGEHVKLVWLHHNLSEHTDSISLMKKALMSIHSTADIYTDSDLCIKSIKNRRNTRKQLIIIVSSDFSSCILPEIHTERSIVAILIYAVSDQNASKLLLDKYGKIINVFSDSKSMLESLATMMHRIEKQTFIFNIFDQNQQKTTRDLSKESASFLWYQMLFNALKQMPQDELAKEQMLDKCTEYYSHNTTELDNITSFRATYRSEMAIEWYTSECFLYKLINKALRTEDVNLLYIFRFFILDLCAEIQQESQKWTKTEDLLLYRGQRMFNDDFEMIQNKVGNLISTNGFFSTSRNINVALVFAGQGTPCPDINKAVLFEVRVKPGQLENIICADIKERSRMRDEEEVLFSMAAVFVIDNVYFDEILNIWRICLQATDKGTDRVKEYIKLVKQQQQKQTSPMIYFGSILLHELGQIDRAGEYFNMLTQRLPPDHPEMGAIYNAIGDVYRKKGDFDMALKNFEHGYMLRRQLGLSDSNPQIGGSLNNIGLIYKEKGDYDRALDYFQTSLSTLDNIRKGDFISKAPVIGNVGLVYKAKNDYYTSLMHLYQSLNMYRRLLPSDHPDIAWCFGLIGDVYESMQNFEEALYYYQQQWEMDKRSLPIEHPDLALDLERIHRINERLMNQNSNDDCTDVTTTKLNA